MENKLLSEIYSTKPANRTSRLEGAIITGRQWDDYQDMLGIKPEALRGETVLNFGSGGSNIGKQLKAQGIACNLVDLDLKYDPWWTSDYSVIKPLVTIPFVLSLKYFNPEGETREKLVNLKRKITGTEGRSFIQGNGRNLPFPDGTFDHILALWSTYQIPPEARENVYQELMRVGKILHLGPIFKNDYDLLSRLAAEQNFEIVACQPIPVIRNGPFMFSSKKDYDHYLRRKNQSDRIEIPEESESLVNITLGKKSAGMRGGNTIVLRRKQD